MKINIIQTGIALLAVLFISSCQYKWNVEPVVPPPDPEDTISFSLQVVPIFDDRGCVGCHNTGGQAPDLTAGNAYQSITSLGLVNMKAPADSKIYYYPLPDGKHFAKYTSAQAAVVLLWIEQGALNN